MPQAIALAITCLACFVFDNLTERSIGLVLEEFALVGNPAEQVMGDLDALSQDLQPPVADQHSSHCPVPPLTQARRPAPATLLPRPHPPLPASSLCGLRTAFFALNEN